MIENFFFKRTDADTRRTGGSLLKETRDKRKEASQRERCNAFPVSPDYWISKVGLPSAIFRVMVPFTLMMGASMLSPPSRV